jgi:hypothetical protein
MRNDEYAMRQGLYAHFDAALNPKPVEPERYAAHGELQSGQHCARGYAHFLAYPASAS